MAPRSTEYVLARVLEYTRVSGALRARLQTMTQADRVFRAARNNAAWCHVVCGMHHANGQFSEAAWCTHNPVPARYPNMVTLANGAIDEQLRLVDEIVLAIGGQHAVAIKDSFLRLDLWSRGFTPLLDGQWCLLDKPPGLPFGSRIEFVSDVAGLSEWEQRWSITNPSRSRVFKPEVLNNNDVSFVAAHDAGGIVAGLIANRSTGVVGISNVFAAPRPATEFFLAALAVVSSRYADLPLAAYARRAELDFIVRLGFEVIGPLRVWVRPAGPI